MDFSWIYYANRPCPLCNAYRVARIRQMIICDDCAFLATFLLNNLYLKA